MGILDYLNVHGPSSMNNDRVLRRKVHNYYWSDGYHWFGVFNSFCYAGLRCSNFSGFIQVFKEETNLDAREDTYSNMDYILQESPMAHMFITKSVEEGLKLGTEIIKADKLTVEPFPVRQPFSKGEVENEQVDRLWGSENKATTAGMIAIEVRTDIAYNAWMMAVSTLRSMYEFPTINRAFKLFREHCDDPADALYLSALYNTCTHGDSISSTSGIDSNHLCLGCTSNYNNFIRGDEVVLGELICGDVGERGIRKGHQLYGEEDFDWHGHIKEETGNNESCNRDAFGVIVKSDSNTAEGIAKAFYKVREKYA